MRSTDEIAAIIEAAARRAFDPALLVGLWVRHDMDGDGDPIFLVRIVVENEFMNLDPQVRLKFLVSLRRELIDLQEIAFPVIDYILRSDELKFRAEAA